VTPFPPLPEAAAGARCIGVVADTHIPDRVRRLHPELLPGLRAAGVDLILHAGDICAPSVITELSQQAPVIAVRGNRDWAFVNTLPWTQTFVAGGVRIAMQHGMGTFWHYWWDKMKYATIGYRFERYRRLLLRTQPGYDAYVFGHTHVPVNRVERGALFFNPGPAAIAPPEVPSPSFGILHLDGEGGIQGEIIPMRRLEVMAGEWVL